MFGEGGLEIVLGEGESNSWRLAEESELSLSETKLSSDEEEIL